MCSQCSFGHLKHRLWPKEGWGVKLAIWLSITKSQESTQFTCMHVSCDIPLKSSWQRLQLCFRPHHNQKYEQKVMGSQSRKRPNGGNFGTPISETKSHLDVASVNKCIIYYMGEGGGFPQVWAVVNLVSPSYSWFILAPKMFQLCTNYFVLVLCRFVWISEAY